jgi:hypothetical protein
VRTTRLDLHLIRVHGMERGEEMLAVVKGSPVITVETKEMVTLELLSVIDWLFGLPPPRCRGGKGACAFHVYHKAFAPLHLTLDTS